MENRNDEGNQPLPDPTKTILESEAKNKLAKIAEPVDENKPVNQVRKLVSVEEIELFGYQYRVKMFTRNGNIILTPQ
jgi:hypothetical protein